MDWQLVFTDIHKWMSESNQVLKRYPITTDDYWMWLVRSVGELGNKYNNHPIVLGFLTTLIGFQEDNYKKIVGR